MGLSFFNKILWLLLIILSSCLHYCQALTQHYHWVVKEAAYTRLCKTKDILTVNGEFPGPTIRVRKGETILVSVYNQGRENITIHWHGVKQPRNPWSDGPAYITQCPIKPGNNFTYKVIFSSEEGTLWWHAHNEWSRATVHGAIIIYPTLGPAGFPFQPPDHEVPIILGEWWKKDIREVYELFVRTGGDPNVSDALTINGQPGDLYPCSQQETYRLSVEQGKTYLLRLINAAMNIVLFFSISNHNLTVVTTDASYTKPLTSTYVTISPGQTLDLLLHANQNPNDLYYMAARAYSSSLTIPFDNTTTTAILQYQTNTTTTPNLIFPYLPYYNDTNAAFKFLTSLRSLANEDHPIKVSLNLNTTIISTISINTFPCEFNNSCEGPNGTRLAASMNNISFVNPRIAILEAYYKGINGVFGEDFPSFPPLVYNFTAEYMDLDLEVARRGTKVKVLKYNTTVEMILQGTNLVGAIDHPMHLHGFSFYVVGVGFGNFDKFSDPLNFNLVDPPMRNTALVPINGWVAIRFRANNPGVWFMHCHIERHLTWGMDTVFIVRNGMTSDTAMLPPPPDMPPC